MAFLKIAINGTTNIALTSNISTVFNSMTTTYACQFLEFYDIGSTTGISTVEFAMIEGSEYKHD